MTLVWTLLAVLIPALLLGHFLRGRPIGHGYLLALGAFFYMVLPFFAYATDAYADGPGEDIWAKSFEHMYAYSGWAIAIGLLFICAYWLGSAVPAPSPKSRLDRPIPPRILSIAFALLTLAWIYFLIQAREFLFSGYLIAYRADLMGPLATVNLAALLLLLNLLQWRQDRALVWAYGGLMAMNSVALLSMGGRLYVATVVVALALRFFNGPRGHAGKQRIAGLLLIMAAGSALALVGLLRMDSELELKTLGKVLLAEPVLTSMSLGTLLDCQLVELLNVPSNFLSSIINFVPSALLPSKEEWLVELDPGGNCLASPFGATNLGAALLINFGVLGSALVVALFAYLLKFIKGRAGSGWWLYYYLCSLLPMLLFRDGFLIFNKVFFATGLLLGLLLIAMSPSTKPSP